MHPLITYGICAENEKKKQQKINRRAIHNFLTEKKNLHAMHTERRQNSDSTADATSTIFMCTVR